jgi:hypothetical protein
LSEGGQILGGGVLRSTQRARSRRRPTIPAGKTEIDDEPEEQAKPEEPAIGSKSTGSKGQPASVPDSPAQNDFRNRTGRLSGIYLD